MIQPEQALMRKQMRVLMCSDDPNTILSYGILSKLMMDKLYPYYDLHYLSLQYQIGNPLPIKDEKGKTMYIKYPAHNQGDRNPQNLPKVCGQVKPDFIWTNFDVQHYMNMKNLIPQGLSWIGWIPWDNHDQAQIPRAQQAFSNLTTKIAISKFGMQFLNKFGIGIEDYIYNIIDTDAYYKLDKDSEECNKFRQMNSWYTPDTKLLLFVGRPNWRKRIIHILTIMKELVNRGNKNIKLFMHTSLNDPSATVNISELIDALGLKHHVVFSQFHWDQGLPTSDLRLLYNMADLYIAPHGGEGFGMPIGEAMACGTPFVASDYCTTREFAGESFERGIPSEVYFPTNPQGQPILDKGVHRPYPLVDKFADKIEQIIYDKDRLEKMGENGIKWVRGNCSPAVVCSKWKKVFDIYDIKYAMPTGYD